MSFIPRSIRPPLRFGLQEAIRAGPSRPRSLSIVTRAPKPFPILRSSRVACRVDQSTPDGAVSRRWNSDSPSTASRAGASTARASQKAQATADEAEEGGLRLEAPRPGAQPQKLAQIEPRLSLTFTCTANDCGHRSTHEFSKRAYTKGIVLVQCPECKSRHLIADHIGWFKESTEDGKLKTVEDLLRAKGETVRTGRVNFDGDIEYDPDSSAAVPSSKP